MYMIGGPIILMMGAHYNADASVDIGKHSHGSRSNAGVGLVFRHAMPFSTAVLPPKELMATASLTNLSTLGTKTLSLSIAGVVF